MDQLATQFFHLAVTGPKPTKPRISLCGLTHLNLVGLLDSHIISSYRSSQESELRKRNIAAPQPPPDDADQLDGHMGIQDYTSKAPTKSQQQQHEAEEQETPKAADQPKESSPVPGTWSPLLTNVCLGTALALSAYVCYRAYFH